MTYLVGLHGQRGAGKDATFEFIKDWASERGLRAERRGFADSLKHSFARLFTPDISLIEAVMWCDRLKLTGTLKVVDMEEYPESGQKSWLSQEITARVALQRYGTEGHRGVFGDNFWVDALLPQEGWEANFEISPFVHRPVDICVVTDLRFENEAERIRELGGMVWLVDRFSKQRDDHVSEKPLDDSHIDRIIKNRETLEVLRHRVELACREEFSP